MDKGEDLLSLKRTDRSLKSKSVTSQPAKPQNDGGHREPKMRNEREDHEQRKSAKRLSGVVPPIGTPLTDGDRVDEPGLRRLTKYLVDAGVSAILANGTMGGFAFLTDEEQLRAISIIVDEVSGAIPVIGGVGETSTVRAVRKAKQICECGVSYLSVLPPYYFFATQPHLTAYFSEIAAAVDLPIFLYDNPVMTKNSIRPETVAELRQRIPKIVEIGRAHV